MGWESFKDSVGGTPAQSRASDRRDLIRVMGGMLARNLFRGFVKLVVAGFLAPRALGILRSVYSLFRIVVALAELGLNHAMVTFVSVALGRQDDEDRERVLRTVMGLNLGIVAGLAFLGNVVARPIAAGLLGDGSLTIWVRIAFLSVGGQLLINYISSHLSAHRAFTRLAFFLPVAPFLMLVTVTGLVSTGHFELPLAMLVYLLAPAATVLLWGLVVRNGLSRPAWDGKTARRILRFSRWVYATNVSAAVHEHANTLLVKNPALAGSLAAGEANAGFYTFGSDMAAEVTVFSESLMSVLLPDAASRSDPDALRSFLRRSYRTLAFLLVPLALPLVLVEPFLLFLGEIKSSFLEYLPALGVFTILYAGSLFSIAAIPLRAALYAMNLPRFEARVELVLVPVVIAGSTLLIPRYGCEGAAWMVFAQRVTVFLAIVAYGLVKLRRASPG